TPIATAFKGTLRDTPLEDLATLVVSEALSRSGLSADLVDDIILAEAGYGGGDLARYAAGRARLINIPGEAVNRHCGGSLTSVGNAAATIRAGMDHAVIAGGVHSSSMTPKVLWRVPGQDEPVQRMASTFPHDERADDDVTLTVGW